MKQERILVAIFWLCLFVLSVNVANLIVNRMIYQRQKIVILQIDEIRQRVSALEEGHEQPQLELQQKWLRRIPKAKTKAWHSSAVA